MIWTVTLSLGPGMTGIWSDDRGEAWGMTYSEEKKVNRVRKGPIMAIMIFLGLWIVGISLGEPARVMELAAQVCLSCIGLD